MRSSYARIAFTSAFRISLVILFTSAVTIPVAIILGRIFHGTWPQNWAVIFGVPATLTALIFAFLFATQWLELVTEQARERQRRLVFPAEMWLRGLYLSCIVMSWIMMIGMYREGDPWGNETIPVVFVLMAFFAWPRAITISDTEVRQHGKLFGTTRIPLNEIETVFSGSSEATVFGKNGAHITHTNMHVQRERFLSYVKSLSGRHINRPGEFLEP